MLMQHAMNLYHMNRIKTLTWSVARSIRHTDGILQQGRKDIS